MIVDDPNFWDLARLEAAGGDALQPVGNGLQRGRARMLVSKIDRFEDIKRRKQALAAVRPEFAQPDPCTLRPCRRCRAMAASTPRGS